MADKLDIYRKANTPLPPVNRLLPLYGAGFENLGRNEMCIDVPMPKIGPDELLVRHDACGLCYSDVKVIMQGADHPRISRDISKEPVVLGHEVTMTVVGVGEKLRDTYHIGDRFIVQADIFVNGVGYAYGYMIQGGLSRYGVIDQRILNGDDGNYLIPVRPETGYAESALVEPWACVMAAYRLQYRTGLKPNGTAWFVGAGGAREDYTISAGFDEKSHPSKVLLSNVPPRFADWLKQRAAKLGVKVCDAPELARPPAESVDDIIVLGADPKIIETVSRRLAQFGIVAIIADKPMPRPVRVDVGRVHYDRWLYVGGTGPDIARAYSETPVRSALKKGGKAWFVGAGGPMGRMHVQRAIGLDEPPSIMVCTDVSNTRLEELRASYEAEAKAKGITFICLNPSQTADGAELSNLEHEGFDDIVVLAPVTGVISEAAASLAPRGVMNIFAGVARGTTAHLNLSDTYLKQTRVIGHSASSIDDLRFVLNEVENRRLATNRSVAAVGSLSAAWDGLEAVHSATYSGKIVIFPNIKDLPLTALPDLQDRLPTVYTKLKDGREWTLEAEQEFLNLMADV